MTHPGDALLPDPLCFAKRVKKGINITPILPSLRSREGVGGESTLRAEGLRPHPNLPQLILWQLHFRQGVGICTLQH